MPATFTAVSRARRRSSRPRWPPAVAVPGGAYHRLHRAGDAIRKLDSSHHHPVDAAVGRVGALLALMILRRRPYARLLHRDHSADGHRQEERHHDDRLRPGCGTQRRVEPGGGDLQGLRDPFPPHHDDHPGGHARRGAAGDWHWDGLGTAAAAGHFRRGRVAILAGADALHHASGLSRVRAHAPVVQASPTSGGRGIYIGAIVDVSPNLTSRHRYALRMEADRRNIPLCSLCDYVDYRLAALGDCALRSCQPPPRERTSDTAATSCCPRSCTDANSMLSAVFSAVATSRNVTNPAR